MSIRQDKLDRTLHTFDLFTYIFKPDVSRISEERTMRATVEL